MHHETEFFKFITHNYSDFSPKNIIKMDQKVHRGAIFGSKKAPFSYFLGGDSSFASGWVRDHRKGETLTWHSKLDKKVSKAEREEYRLKLNRLKLEAEEERLNAYKIAAETASKEWGAAGEATGNDYSVRKLMQLDGLRQNGQDLIVPVDIDGRLTSLQFLQDDGFKQFLSGGEIKGGGCWIGEPRDGGTVIVCEGYATGSSIAQATGIPVRVAFNAGNLKAVATQLKKKYKIIIAADNDEATVINGVPTNVGVIKAREAAESISGACVIVPHNNLSNALADTPVSDTPVSIDFNDLHVNEGLQAVKAAFDSALNVNNTDYAPLESHEAIHDIPEPRGIDIPFEVLGYDMGTYYYLPANTRQVVGLTPSSHTLQNLFRLAPQSYWLTLYGGEGMGAAKIAQAACDSLMQEAHRKGTFKTEERLRGSGAWIDGGNVVYNYGTGAHDLPEISRFYYVNSAQLPDLSTPLSSKRAAGVYDLLKLFPFDQGDLAAGLVAGWLALAPICGALEWRPHIWITGGAGSGKSTLLEVMRRILGSYALQFDGGSTEAGLRGSMMFDSRPIVMDEAEGETETQRRNMQAILEYARKSSRGGHITKAITGGGGAINYACRGMFCFSAINPIISEGADESRVTLIQMHRRDDREAYERILTAVDELFTPDFTGAFIARAIANVRTTLENVKAFKYAASVVYGGRTGMRGADQIGTILAGLYSLHSIKRIERKAALEWLERNDLSFIAEQSEIQDQDRLLERICSSTISGWDTSERRTINAKIGDFIGAAMGENGAICSPDTAIKALGGYGIRPMRGDGKVYIANTSSGMRGLLKDTPWSAKWHLRLKMLGGAEQAGSRYFAAGLTSRCVVLPYNLFTGG